ncbi:MAG: DUF5666 domain-containing protein [Pseudomonadota bacterium]
MTRIDRRVALFGMSAGLLSACSDLDLAEGKPEPKGGLGGTGIVGTLTDFGSLLVNGLRVETASALSVSSALGALAVEALAIGHQLTIEAATEDGRLVAKRVHLAHPVIGQVAEMGSDGRTGSIAGIRVALDPDAIGSLALGAWVAISGTWQGDQVRASRIDPAPEGAEAIAGEVRVQDDGRLTIGDVTLLLGDAEPPQVGGYVTVIGRASEAGFLVDGLEEGRFTGAAGPLATLSIEGYLEPTPQAPFYAISGLGHSFDREAALASVQQERAVFSGAYIGSFKVETALVLPEEFAKRREVLRDALAVPGSVPLISTR